MANVKIKLSLPILLSLILVTSVVVSVATTVTVSRSLDRYLAQLNAEIALDRRALGSVRTVTGDGSAVEQLMRVRERSGAMLRTKIVNTSNVRALQEEQLLASGVAITSDGWYAFPIVAQGNITLSNVELVTGDRIFSVDRTLRDERNGILYVHAAGSAESPVSLAHTLGLSPGDELYLTDMTGFIDRTRIVYEKYTEDFSVNFDTEFASSWELEASTRATGILFDGNIEFVGFLVNGEPIPLHAFASSLSSAVQSQKLSQATLGIAGVDVTRAQNIDLALYGRRGFLITTDATHVGVLPEGPANVAGLQVNDMIIAIDGILISSTESITKILSQFTPGEKVTVSYIRDGGEYNTDVVLANADHLIY